MVFVSTEARATLRLAIWARDSFITCGTYMTATRRRSRLANSAASRPCHRFAGRNCGWRWRRTEILHGGPICTRRPHATVDYARGCPWRRTGEFRPRFPNPVTVRLLHWPSMAPRERAGCRFGTLPQARSSVRASTGYLRSHAESRTNFSFANGSALVTSSDGATVVWDLDVSLWAEKICQAAGRNLTESEWTKYFPGREYETTCPQWPPKPNL